MIRNLAAAALVVMLSPFAAVAGERTVVLSVENATCDLCGPIVKRSLSRVSGVKAVTFKEATATSGAMATVKFDDAATNVEVLIGATTNAGYPSKLNGQGG